MLLINLNYQDKVPIYEQIVNTIEKYVGLGILKENEQMPSIRELASNLGINPNTVKKAYDILENKKVIVSISTKGTFINNKKEEILLKQKQELKEKIILEINNLKVLGLNDKDKADIIDVLKK